MKSFSTEEGAATESVGPATFYIREAGVIVGSIAMFACLSLFGVLFAWGALQGEGAPRTAGLGAACVFMLIAVGLPIWGAFRTKFVIDPVRGEIRVSREYELPFSKVRKIEVVSQEFTHTAPNLEGGSYSAACTGWGIDLGARLTLLVRAGMSRKRVVEIADALKARVHVYRARTGEAADPLPRPSKMLLDRMAGSLHCENNAFEDDWLSIDGPMAEWMREMHYEPDERTMGRDGEFAQALRKVGYDLGDAPTPAPPGEDAR